MFAEAYRGGAGRTGRHLLGAANGRKLFLKIHVKIQIVISYVFACNKNKHYSCSAYLSSVSWAITLGLWLRPVRLCWYYAEYLHLKTNPLYQHNVMLTAN